MSVPYIPKLNRRETVQWIAATSLVSAFPHSAEGRIGAIVTFTPVINGYGTDPHLHEPVVTWPRTMTPHQLGQVAAWADLILPAQEFAPAPSALGVPDFVDEWISAPYPEQQRDRRIILDGLRWLDEEAVRRERPNFLELDLRSQQSIADYLARSKPESDTVMPAAFFQRLRFLVISAYYTTPEGFKDIGYTGNVPLVSYPAITKAERDVLENALSKLGLSAGKGNRKL